MEKVFHKCLKNTIDLLSFYGEHFYGIVVIYKTVEKKNPFFNKHIYIYIWVTDILKFYEVYFVHIVKVCFVLKNSQYVCIPLHMHKTLPTFENKKKQ